MTINASFSSFDTKTKKRKKSEKNISTKWRHGDMETRKKAPKSWKNQKKRERRRGNETNKTSTGTGTDGNAQPCKKCIKRSCSRKEERGRKRRPPSRGRCGPARPFRRTQPAPEKRRTARTWTETSSSSAPKGCQRPTACGTVCLWVGFTSPLSTLLLLSLSLQLPPMSSISSTLLPWPWEVVELLLVSKKS